MKIHHKSDYRALRRAHYPDAGDQLDAVLALAESLQQSGYVLPEKVRQWMESCQDVKRRYPKR
ncbi:hypothetical protein RKE25_21585 [Dyella sp. BiH032]|uniref:hypothetical protein n=1 Tax=Dyella sp. BiH032 TaxID=3075430 RepID=UPI0028935BD3|nr:hypothetical protein [Dyella sp. BiH032]WNL45969.1 hypothetical protein RKE25_21585 [Dyella sp. BiH032]